jgi:hypothetical protein
MCCCDQSLRRLKHTSLAEPAPRTYEHTYPSTGEAAGARYRFFIHGTLFRPLESLCMRQAHSSRALCRAQPVACVITFLIPDPLAWLRDCRANGNGIRRRL